MQKLLFSNVLHAIGEEALGSWSAELFGIFGTAATVLHAFPASDFERQVLSIAL